MTKEQISNEDLFALLEKELQKKEASSIPNKTPKRQSRYQNQIERFIQEKAIKAGDRRVPVHRIFYEYYMNWDGVKNSVHKSSAEELGRIFSKHFPKHRSGAYRYYMLNEFCDLTRPKMKESKKWYDKFYNKRKKAKRQGKVSEHKSEC